MDEKRKKVLMASLYSIGIFVIGIVLGFQINYDPISKIQGYLYNTFASATNTNATNSNATSSNATSSNATSSNATSSNTTDGILFLNEFLIKNENAKIGDKVYVDITTTGACLNGVSIMFKNLNGDIFVTDIMSLNNNAYIVIPENVIPGTYQVANLLLIGLNGDNSTFTKEYTSSDFTFASNLKISIPEIVNNDNNGKELDKVVENNNEEIKENSKNENKVEEKLTLNSISLKENNVKIGEKVYFDYATNKKITSLKLKFVSENNMFTAFGKNLNGKAYFEIPSITKSGNYTLESIIVGTDNEIVSYDKKERENTIKMNFNIVLEIVENEKETYIYNNDNINKEIITKIYNAKENTTFTINADSNPFINEDVFNAIKGKNKTLIISYNDNKLIFKGEDITNSKTINVNIELEKVKNNEEISKLVSDGIIVNFADNGNLPGKALIKIKDSEIISKSLNNSIYIYYFVQSNNNFILIDSNVTKTKDGYYEFTITHNSKYLLTNDKLDDLLISKDNINTVTFQKSKKIQVLLIIVGALFVTAGVVVYVILKKKNNKIKK